MTDSQHEKVITPEPFPARFFYYSSASQFITSHWHNSLEILFMKSGLMDVGVNSETYHLEQGDLIVINSGDIHYTLCRRPSFVLALQIPYPLLKAHIPNYSCVRFQTENGSCLLTDSPCHGAISAVLEELYSLSLTSPQGCSLRFSSLIYDLVYRLDLSCHTDISSSLRRKNDRNLTRLEQVTAYVKQHYTQPISLEEGASILSLNPEYFCRYFKKHMGITFLEYVNSVRLEHIHRDLLETDDPISDLLERHGFLNYKLFMKMFRRSYGCAPSALRKQSSSFPSGPPVSTAMRPEG